MEQILFLPLVSRWQVMKPDFSCIISWSFCFLQIQDLISGAMQLKHLLSLAPRVEDHDVQTLKWWISTGKNPLHSSLAWMTRVVRWMFQINKAFFYAVFPRSAYYWILFRPTSASGCHEKIVQLYFFPISLGQVYFVLVFTSTNHKARNRYPEMVMAWNVKWSETIFSIWSWRRMMRNLSHEPKIALKIS